MTRRDFGASVGVSGDEPLTAPAAPDLWWHLFVRRSPEIGANVTTVFGESEKSPDEAPAIGLTFDPPILHVQSFDHDPDGDEIDNAILDRLLTMLEAK